MLTRLLESSLRGNARTCIICAITLADRNVEETASTLRFAKRAQTVAVKPEVNRVCAAGFVYV
jgi:hypothetical protein